MKVLKAGQVYYSLGSDPVICANAVADLIRADRVSRGQGPYVTSEEMWNMQREQMRRQAEIFGARIEKVMAQAIRDILG